MIRAVHDLRGPLPRGHLHLEASAGTGKTFALVALATRFLAEGACTADQLLMVTFSRSATRELRARLLARLDASTTLLRGLARGMAPPAALDELEEQLVSGTSAEVAQRLGRLDAALADIDHATVTTIHGFCDDLLRRIGDPMLGELLTDESELASQITADLFLRIASHDPELVRRLPKPGPALAVVRAGMANPPESLVPDRELRTAGGVRAWMAFAAGKEAESRKQHARVHTYDDLVTRLGRHLVQTDDSLLAQLRQRFIVGLVDEFQDTDPGQWLIFSTLFPDPDGADGRALVLVGDPKQAIYAFRGADLHTYLAARGTGTVQTLGTNHRADKPLVDAVTTLFSDVPLGPPPVRVHQLETAHATRMDPPPVRPMAFRVISDEADLPTHNGSFRVAPARQHVAADVGAQVVDLLQRGSRLHLGDAPAGRPLAPQDITVLVRKNAQAALVQQELWKRGVPTVLNGVGNVLLTPAATDWLAVLLALQQPSERSQARRAALTDLVGWPLGQVARGNDVDLDSLHVLLHEMADHLQAHGVASALRWIDDRTGMSPRLRTRATGNRRLADLIHLTELLHAEQRRAGLGLPGLVAWLEQSIAAALDPAPDGLARRLEQAGDAVEIMTTHSAKGLERGIVLVPYLWDTAGGRDDILTYTDPATGRRRVDVGGKSDHPLWQQAQQLAEAADEEEELRLAYVALTRGRHHAVVWWVGTTTSVRSPLSLILGRGTRTRDTAQALDRIGALVQAHPDHFHVDVTTDVDDSAVRVQPRGVPDLHLATLDQPIDRGWRRWSYSRLVSQQEAGESDSDHRGADGVPAPEEEDGLLPTGQPSTDPSAEVSDPATTALVPLSDMPGGADVGTTIHRVLELIDFDVGPTERAGQIAIQLAAQATTSAVDLSVVEGVVEGLQAMLETPLGRIAGGRSLAELSRGDRLDELDFEMPVLRGPAADQPGRLLLADIADLLHDHTGPTDPLRAYPDALRGSLGEIEVRGFLAGQIDLVARIRGDDGAPDRFVVADYKTNRVAPPDADGLRIGHYRTPALAAEMIHHHYPLQALIYLVATHRYLRWRLPGYDPDTHLAGSAYLFLRGMAGADAPTQPDGTAHGVMAWRPPTPLLLALDRLLTTGASR